MGKQLSFIIIGILAVQLITAQQINFKKGSWDEILLQSKTANKLIFLDIYAVWCGPCKAMARNVFTQVTVADKFNTSFINYMVDAEKGEGITIAEKYQVTSFPTYLFIDSKGKLIHKIEGALPADKLIQEANTALQKNKIEGN